MNCKSQAKEVDFLVLDFGRGACTETCSRESRLLIKNYANLFAMSRLFWVNFADQNNLTWGIFFDTVVIPMIRASLFKALLDYMVLYLRNSKIGKKRVILVDEILKTLEIDVEFAEPVRESICSWMGEMGVCDVILFSTLDVKFMTDERTYSGRPVNIAVAKS